MENNSVRKTINFIKTEKRLFLVLAFLAITFIVNRTLYIGQKITTEKCSIGNCLTATLEKPQLTKDNSYYYVDDLFKDQPSGYYRLTFQEKTDQATKVLLKLNTYTEKENQIAELTLAPADKFQNQEVFFFLPDGFDSLLLQKEDAGSSGNVFLKSAGITKLNINSETELAAMKPTVIGETDASVVKIGQSGSNFVFPWLRDAKTSLGQVFRSKEDVISAVSLKIDITKDLNPSSRQYTLSLREVNYSKDDISYAGQTIASIGFSLRSIEKYRQADGTFLFPLYGQLEKDKYYLIGLDNSKVDVTGQNYLELKGSNDDASYPDGTAVVKEGKDLYRIKGDLFFRIYGADYSLASGVRILNAAKIEDLGKGIGKYSYAASGKAVDLLDLDSASPGTQFSDNDKVIFAPVNGDTNFSYAVNMLYPVSKFNFSAQQSKASWKRVQVSYSFDQNTWINLDYSEKTELVTDLAVDQSVGAKDNGTDNSADSTGGDNSGSSDNTDTSSGAASSGGDSLDASGDQFGQQTLQVFNADIVPTKETRTVYFKITYDPNDPSKGKSFALKDLKITADLKMK